MIDLNEWVCNTFQEIAYTIVGIDPGTTHVGLSLITGDLGVAWEIRKEREPTMEKRMLAFVDMLDYLSPNGARIVVIEGPGYMSSSYRQAELEDIRCATVLWKELTDVDEIQVVPPNTIRKVVFGSGKIKNPWDDLGLPNNAAAALGCALYPIYMGK